MSVKESAVQTMQEIYSKFRPPADINEVLDFLIQSHHRKRKLKGMNFVEAVERDDYDIDVIVAVEGQLYAYTCREGSEGYAYDWTGEVRKVEKKVKTVAVYE